MRKNGCCFLMFVFVLWFASVTRAETLQDHPPMNQQLMTARDIAAYASSNITIQNKTGAPITVYGLYINQFASSNNGFCESLNNVYYTNNNTGGAFVSPVSFKVNEKIQLGSNYLYNMLYTGIFYGNSIQSPLPPMPCALPGCTWPGDTPSTWCLYIGVLSPSSQNQTTSTIPPFGTAASSGTYNYDLVQIYGSIGPITCNDQSLTCSVSRPQYVAFPQ